MSHSQSHSGSSAEDDYEDDAAMPEAQWQSPQQSSANPTTSAGPSSTQPSQISMPMQKRRRVTRACDECRRKKIKCDGKQPCTHCTVYSYGQYQNALFRRATGNFGMLKADCYLTQNAPMINHRTEDVIQPLSMSKHWRIDSSAPKRS